MLHLANNWLSKKSKYLRLSAYTSILLTFFGCAPPIEPKSTLAEIKQAFQTSILELETEQKKVKTDFKEGRSSLLSFQSALKSAQDKDKEFAKVYNRWSIIQGRITSLYDKFLSLVDGADRVYTELDNRANKIMNIDLRERIKTELQASIERYASRLKLSKSGIDRLRDKATKVTDVMSALEVRFTLKVVEDELGTIFKEIDETVEAVMAQLEVLIEESKHFPMASPLSEHG